MSETQASGGGTIRGDENLDEDARQLEALGYKSHFSRTMSLAANFSLGFTYLSPLVGVYTLFAFVVAIGGAAAIWTYPIAMAGQLLRRNAAVAPDDHLEAVVAACWRSHDQ